ncbi:MAG: prephenate dehydrogenase [Planctomycetes bacterium]|nr:prephenate dehydrogenase [Planctomycetota bacterium]
MGIPTVAIVGLGQIGGSFAAALTGRRLARVVGITRRAETAARARRMGILAEAGRDLAAVSDADVVVLATPVRTLLRQIPEVAPLVRRDAILTDVGSTKTEILEALRRAKSPATVIAVHPMAGNERAGLDGCDAKVFENRPWVLIGERRKAGLLERLVAGVGARPFWMRSPQDHDLKVARVSHIPYLLAYALMGTPEEAIRVCGNSFRDATRVAGSDPDMVLDFLITNRGPIRKSAGELSARLAGLVRMIGRGDAAGLRRALQRARARRAKI